MDFHFNYGPGGLSFAVPDENLLYVATPEELTAPPEPRAAVLAALAHPVGTAPLARMVQPGQRVVLLCDDLTRPTPQDLIVPLLLDELNRGGVPDTQITIVVGLGTHRPMTAEEIVQRFGQAVVDRVEVINHDYLDADAVVDLGATSLGFPVQISRRVVEADFRVAVGVVLPHPLAGWSGGAKILLPGVASAVTTTSTHYLGCIQCDPLDLAGNPDNVVRRQIEEVGARVGLDFIVNVVTDAQGRLAGCAAGHFVAAHRAAVAIAERVYRPAIPAAADIVVADAYPADRDFWQAFKPFVYAHLGLRPGGTLILCVYAREGLTGDAPEHEATLRTWSAAPVERTLAALDAGSIADRIAGAMCVAHGRLLKRAEVLCVSQGMDDDTVRALGFRPAASPAAALAEAFRRLGPAATVGVLPLAGETLVRAC